jgi:3-phosphoshikimate 1-carboxyvinyltransferase
MKEIYRLGSLRGSIQMPPDKSIAHRSAMFASIAEGTSVIRNYSLAADPQTTLACFRALGVPIEQVGTTVTVRGVGRDGLRIPAGDLDCGNSGTTVRLMMGILAGAGISARMIGDASLSGRPMKRVLGPLSSMGLRYEAREGGLLPLQLLGAEGGKLKAIRYELPIPSAQVKSCVLLAGLYTDEPTRVVERVLSRDHTERLIGVDVEEMSDGRVLTTSRNTEIPLQNYAVPGDFSAAAFWLVAGSIYPDSEIRLKHVGVNPTRTAALDILRRMGADIEIHPNLDMSGEPVADIVVRSAELFATEILPEEVPNCIDELPVLSVAMAYARGISLFRGAEELRHKESDRLDAVAAMLKGAGVRFTEHEDGLTIQGQPGFVPGGAVYESVHDHRIAMSAGILAGLSGHRSTITHPECTAISYPDFWEDLHHLSGS